MLAQAATNGPKVGGARLRRLGCGSFGAADGPAWLPSSIEAPSGEVLRGEGRRRWVLKASWPGYRHGFPCFLECGMPGVGEGPSNLAG